MKGALFAAASLAALAASAPALAETETIALEGRNVRVHVPGAGKRALVLMLHGCTQTADGFADATRMDEVADEEGFVVAYPEQTKDDGLNACWQWWDSAHQRRDGGEPKLLASIAAALASRHGIDGERIYVAGLSAGAAMSVILGATYPDRFAAIGVVAGLEYGAASSLSGVLAASTGGGPDPDAQGAKAREAMGDAARVVPAMVIHGDADAVIAPVNGEQVARQWLRTNTLLLGDGAIAPPVTTSSESGYPFTREVHALASGGGTVVERIVVSGLGHAWPGGRDGGSFSDPKGPDASRALWTFFAPRTLAEPAPPPPADPGAGAETGAPSPSGTKAGDAPAGADDGGCSASRRGSGAGWPALLALASAACLARRRARRHCFV